MVVHELVTKIVTELEDHKASNVVVYNNNKITDHMIVVSCESNKHGKALASYITKHLKSNKLKYNTEGLQDAN